MVTNAVVLWNTVYLSAVLDQLRTEDHNVDDGDVVHLSPARYAHINPLPRHGIASLQGRLSKLLRKDDAPAASIASTSQGNSIEKAFAR